MTSNSFLQPSDSRGSRNGWPLDQAIEPVETFAKIFGPKQPSRIRSVALLKSVKQNDSYLLKASSAIDGDWKVDNLSSSVFLTGILFKALCEVVQVMRPDSSALHATLLNEKSSS